MIRRAGGLLGLVDTLCLLAAPAAVAAPVFTPVSGSPFATGNTPLSVAFSPGGGL